MKTISLLVSSTFIFLILLGNFAHAQDIAVIARDDFPKESLDIHELKIIYMGIKLFSGKTRLSPIDQQDRNSIKKVFLKKVLDYNIQEYDSYWAIRTFGGIIPPPTKKTSRGVVHAVLEAEGAIGYVWRNEAKEEGIKILLVILGDD